MANKYKPYSIFEEYTGGGLLKKGHIFHRLPGQDADQFIMDSLDEIIASDRTISRHPYMYDLPSGL